MNQVNVYAQLWAGDENCATYYDKFILLEVINGIYSLKNDGKVVVDKNEIDIKLSWGLIFFGQSDSNISAWLFLFVVSWLNSQMIDD